MSIKERIKELAEYHNITISAFEKSINASNGYVNSISKSIGLDKITKILEVYSNLDLEWLITGNGSMFKDNPNSLTTESVHSSRKTADAVYDLQRVPLFNLEATLGLVPLMSNGNDDAIIDYLTIPNLPSCDGAIYATGDSMYPLLKSGDIIAFKRVDTTNLFFGEMYILSIFLDESNTYKTVKFVQKSELGDDYIKLVSQNQHHSSRDIRLNQIAAIGLVRASIRIHG
ncbi:helix-turn-helix transcriptional regulator [Flavobacterium sp. HSC-61S13]|uniref:S24 family peptidase n=1 Tax=Flavobacterium sp. HSC-61S13 TaxID=2910963 RepID=UPI0020A1B934|nr:S24 family peptidase [Flavobacterium sp. HSC-61S13]MCP1997269.1 phage repressor protein C with HTH and peptisase S24 domain [Flavobacterium sp. HSC-61S13]